MLGRAGTKNLNSVKMPDGAGHYFIWDWHEKSLFTENIGRD